jgi:hypothetical protein
VELIDNQYFKLMINYQRLSIGDRLLRTKGGIFSTHHVLYMGFWNGQHLVAENQSGYGVRYITLSHFLSEGKLEEVQYNNFPESTQIELIRRVNSKIGTPYDLLTYNCEHFVNQMLTGIAESKQIQNTISLVGLGVLLYALAFGESKKC